MKIIDYLIKIFNLQKLRLYVPILKARFKCSNNVFFPVSAKKKINILFYHQTGLFYGGTQKHLQIISKYLNKNKFNVYYLCSKNHKQPRRRYLENEDVNILEFDYSSIDKNYPRIINDMQPHIFDIIKKYSINVVFGTGEGYPEFPFVNLTKIPIIYINIFGKINIQNNMKKIFCVSRAIADCLKGFVPNKKIEILYNQTEMPDAGAELRGIELRRKLNIPQDSIVFGRIGRSDNNIFDSIGIKAFQIALNKYNNIHYIILAPPHKLCDIVEIEKIKNVHFLDETGDEKDIWTFHSAIDVLAHFRYDGETSGLNIIESMISGNPVISHKSKFWNAHLEYLTTDFSRIADLDDVKEYARFIEFFADDKDKIQIKKMGVAAKEKALRLFWIESNIKRIEKNIIEVL